MTRCRHNFRYAKNKSGKALLVPKDTDNFVVWNLPDDYDWLDGNPEVLEKILLDISEGKTLRELCEEHALPVTAVLKRAQRDKEFGEFLFNARRYRAEHYHDQLAKIIETTGEGSAKSDKVKADILRHLMSVGDRDRFGEQKKVSTESAQTVTFIVDTGITRQILPAKGEVVRERLEDGRESNDNEDQHGVSAEAAPAPDPLEAEAVQCAGVPSSVRQDGSVH